MCSLASCGTPAPSIEAAPPERPAVPNGWHEITSDAGDVRLALPADVDAIFTEAGIMAQEPARNGAPQFEVLASGPANAVPQPRGAEPSAPGSRSLRGFRLPATVA